VSRADALQRLRSARGHLDGVIRMLEEFRYCTDVLYQLNAVERALEHAKRAILDEHLHVCVRDPERRVNTDEFVDELLNALYGGRPSPGARYCAVAGDDSIATPAGAGGD
jgi:CsoR family transcriptional regulator, copper-sensing transcriptional repressor